jgi:hypothetical protein
MCHCSALAGMLPTVEEDFDGPLRTRGRLDRNGVAAPDALRSVTDIDLKLREVHRTQLLGSSSLPNLTVATPSQTPSSGSLSSPRLSRPKTIRLVEPRRGDIVFSHPH